MSLKDKLQIIVITYNRAKLLANTLDQLFAQESPVKDYSILVLDNNSTDDTAQTVKNYQKEHPNLKYQKNPHNIGLAANIAKALEIADMQYLWPLADDDIIYWQAWPHLEKAIKQGEEIICTPRYNLDGAGEPDTAAALMQFTFISGNIYKTSLFTDTVMANVMNNIYTLFPHLPIAIDHINKGKKIYFLPEPLVNNGMKPETDVSYIRGYDNTALYLKQSAMSWIVGYANVIAQIKDKKTRHKIITRPINKEIHKGWFHFYRSMYNWYWRQGNFLPVFEVAKYLPLFRSILLFAYLLSPVKIYATDKCYMISIFGAIKTKIWPKKK